VRDYVLANLAEDVTLKSAAAVACLSQTYFSSLFARLIGEGFTVWLARQRIEEAARLLTEHNRSIAEVRVAVGFGGNARGFGRWFKRFMGESPQGYRARQRPHVRAQMERTEA
jgi:transcriptional regulator GlxA family with amidase domain